MAANSQDPDALCFMGIYFGRFKQDWSAEEKCLEKAIQVLFPKPFPDLSKIE